MDSYFLHWAVILCSHVIFLLKLPGFGQREPLQPASVPFWHALIVFLKPMLMFCLTEMLQAHLALSLPWPKNWLFLQGDLFPFSVEWLPQTFLWLREKQNLFRAHLFLSSVTISPNTVISSILLLSTYYILVVEDAELNKARKLLTSCPQPLGRVRPVNR